MWVNLFIFLFIFYYIGFAKCGYQLMGDEVQPGSVLLPSSRRGRYLANIARRQAVDGTGIKFNQEADRINAEAKKKVDVLSEELLPYIIAEQERRVTLYQRVMTAIQNGEKGVTLAEIRNKPTTFIRKGIMYRCPTNRAPREPDGSGAIFCEDNLDPTPIIFESCLSAEDKELFVADNKYFFCNRHKTEGPDLPRNGTTVIGCPPCERTSLNYTSQKCALEDTADVVVHYRYYPDKSYKFVSELDPDREVCEHWNPCQVGYIFSLPGPDQASPAVELWHDYTGDTDCEISREEIVPPVPDDMIETTFLGQNYVTRTRQVLIPNGYEFHGVGKFLPNGLRTRISRRQGALENFDNIEVKSEVVGTYVEISMFFRPMRAVDAMSYYVRFEEIAKKENFIHIPLVTLRMGLTRFTSEVVCWKSSQELNAISINFTCAHCLLRSIMLRNHDGFMHKLDEEKYRLHKFNDDKGVEQSIIDLDTKLITLQDFGDYFLMIQNDDCGEEQIKALTLKGMGDMQLTSQVVCWLSPEQASAISINITSANGALRGIMLHAHDGVMRKVDADKYQLREFKDDKGVEHSIIDLDTKLITPQDFGDYFLMIQDDDCGENQIKALTLKGRGLTPFTSQVVCWQSPEQPKAISINFTFTTAVLRGIMLQVYNGSMRKVDEDKYHLRKFKDDKGVEQSIIDLDTKLITPQDFGDYFLMVKDDDCGEDQIKALTLNGMGQTKLTPQVVYWLPPQELNATSIKFTCAHCELRIIMLRVYDGSMRKVDEEKYNLRKFNDDKGVEQSIIDLNTDLIRPRDFGDYFLMIPNDVCGEEQVHALTLKVPEIADMIQLKRLRVTLPFVEQFENVTYTCTNCVVTDVLCKGRSELPKGLFKIDPVSKTIVVSIYRFACVYMGIFKIGDTPYRKIVAILSNPRPALNISGGGELLVQPPVEGTPFVQKIDFSCKDPCVLNEVTVNGIPLDNTTLEGVTLGAYFSSKNRTLTISIPEYTSLWEGMYLGEFMVNGSKYTKDLMEIGPKENQKNQFLHAYVDEDLEGMEEMEDTMSTPADDRRSIHQPPETAHSGGIMEQSCTVHILREAVQAGHAYNQKTVEYTCPSGQLVAISCRGQNVTTGLGISPNNTVSIDFDHFEDTNACVYNGIFKINETEHRKTLAVLENSSPMINVTVSAVEPPPPSGEFNHKVVYTCNVAKCDPAMIYINDKTLKSDDTNSLYSYKSEMVKENDKEIMTVTVNFSIKPFTKEYEGVYQLVVTNGTERVTKNIMEIGALT